jgi:hypothetical protein
MWVRSQGKHTLMKVNTFQVWDDKKTNIWYVKGIGLCERKLGKYSTEEKALKVLDMIEKHIDGLKKKYIVKDIGNPDGYEVLDNMYIPNQNGKITRIFQMPQDDEV